MYFRRILVFTILIVLTMVSIAFCVRWERVGKLIATSEFSSQYELFNQSNLSDAEVFIGEIVFGSSKDTAISFCPSFRRLRTIDMQAAAPSHHLSKIILLDQKPNRGIGYHIDTLFLSCRLERDYSQETLLGYTLSKVYLGSGEYGVTKASISLFETPVEKISDIETFQIAALIQSPSLRNNKEAWDRRTLALMTKFGSVN